VQQDPDDHVAKDHVEQQLLVVPAGAIAAAAQVLGVSVGKQVMQGQPGGFQLRIGPRAVQWWVQVVVWLRPSMSSVHPFTMHQAAGGVSAPSVSNVRTAAAPASAPGL